MAITFVGGATAEQHTAVPVTITLPGGMAQNDIVLAMSSASGGATISTAGYSSIHAGDLDIFYKFMGSTPDTTVVFNSKGNNGQACVAMVFRGVNTTTPLDVTRVSFTGSLPSVDPSAITPASNNCCIVVAAGQARLDTTIGTITNYSSPVTITSSGSSSDATTGALYRILTGGAGVSENPSAFSGWSGSVSYNVVTLALRQASVIETITVNKASAVITGKTVTVGTLDTVPVTKATVTWTGKTVTIRELELVPVTQAAVTMDGQTVVILSTGTDAVGVDQAAVTLVGKTVTVTDTPAVITIDKAVFALTGKSVGLLEKTAITKATVTFTGRTVTIVTSVFQDLPKYIIRGRGSRHELWTQGFGGTIKGRGSRTFLVMR